MNKVNLSIFKYVLIVISFTLSSTAFSADAPANLADVWKMVPNDGQASQFESAFKEHLLFRKKQNDPRNWQTYTPVIGDDLNFYIVRYCCLNWADLDSYQQWSEQVKMMEHWNKIVAPFINRYEHYFSELDFANSNWPESTDGMEYFAVTQYQVKMGKGGTTVESKKTLSDYAKAMKWPYYWSWSDQIGAADELSLVIPYKTYADMAPPETSFYQAIVKHLNDKGKANTIFSQWSSNFASSHYTVYRLRADLSMP